MREVENKIPDHQPGNMLGLLKGDLTKLDNPAETRGPEDIALMNFWVNAGSGKDLFRICNQIEEILENYSIPADKRVNFLIALIEAINNAQEHGYQFSRNKIVAVNLFMIGNDYILIGIESVGEPIPMDKIKRLLKEDNPLKIGRRNGRGYILMKNSVDVLYVSHYKFYTEVFLGIFKEKDNEGGQSLN